MKNMTNEQLIRATYVVAKYENPRRRRNCLTELAGRLDCALVAARTACLERDAAVRAEIEWETAMRQAVGEDGVDDVVLAIEKLKAALDVQSARSEALAAENAAKTEFIQYCFRTAADGGSLDGADIQELGGSLGLFGRETYQPALHGYICGHEAGEDTVYVMKKSPATDAWLNEQRATWRVEGVNFAASRLAAAFNHGFIDKPTAEVYDVVKAVLGAKEELATAPDDGLSGEYAEQALNDWAAQLRGSQV